MASEKVNLLMLGDAAVGKSSLVLRFAEDEFSFNTMNTIGIDFRVRTVRCNGRKFRVQIWDTAGQERFKSIAKTYYRGAEGIVLVYDVTVRKSFTGVQHWMSNIAQHASEGVRVVLVGNKVDLPDRKVTTDEAVKLAQQYNIEYMETSAKDAINVEKLFLDLVEAVQASRSQIGSQRDKGINLQGRETSSEDSACAC